MLVIKNSVTKMKNSLMGFLVNGTHLREESLGWRMYQQNPQKPKRKEKTQKQNRIPTGKNPAFFTFKEKTVKVPNI